MCGIKEQGEIKEKYREEWKLYLEHELCKQSKQHIFPLRDLGAIAKVEPEG
jgi:hypothetical protein